MNISFSPITPLDYPLLHRWLNTPHVLEWWHDPLDYAGVIAKYEPRIDGRELIVEGL